MTSKQMRRTWSAALLMVVAVLTAACGSGGDDENSAGTAGGKEPITVEFVGEFSGSPTFAPVLGALRAGLDTALKVVNDEGGVDGHQLRYTIHDAQFNPNTAAAVLRDAISKNPPAMVGFLSSADLAANVSLLKQSNVPFITAGSLFDPIDKMPTVFTLYQSQQVEAKDFGRAVNDLLGGSLTGKKVGIEHISPSPAIDSLVELIKEDLTKRGATVSIAAKDPITIQSWSSQAANVVRSNIDALVMLSGGEANVQVVGQALKVAGFNKPFITRSSSSSDATFASVDSPYFHAFRDNRVPTEGTPLYEAIKAAKADVSAASAQPGYFAKGYALGFALREALKECGYPCKFVDFPKALHKAGQIEVPNNPYYSPVDFTTTREGLGAAQLFKWDPATKKAVEFKK